MSNRLPVVVIVGRPNVGKSTLFNRLIGKRMAVVEDTPGITRDRLYAVGEWEGKRFQVVDTGGIVFQDEDPLHEQIRVQAEIALEEADVVLFMTDAVGGLNPGDRELADSLRGIKKPVYVVVNKADSSKREMLATEFYELGIGDVWPISSLHGRGVGDLMDQVIQHLPDVKEEEDQGREEVKLAIIGRPNVGKSSLLNAFSGEKRVIVSAIPGTTRDAVDTIIQYEGETFRLVDTAGIRRKGKIQGTVEYYMVHRAQKAIERADCALIVIDGQEALTDGDKRIAKMAHDAGKAVVIAVNKWDLQEPPNGCPGKPSQLKRDFRKIIKNEDPELDYAEICFTSAKESAGLAPVLNAVLRALDSYSFRISTGALNRLIQDAVDERPFSRKGKILKIYYATQVSTRPPTFVLFCNDAELMHFSYMRYLLNRIRKEYPLQGTALKLIARQRTSRF